MKSYKGHQIFRLSYEQAHRTIEVAYQNSSKQPTTKITAIQNADIFTHALLLRGHAIEASAICQTLYVAPDPDLSSHFSSVLQPFVSYS